MGSLTVSDVYIERGRGQPESQELAATCIFFLNCQGMVSIAVHNCGDCWTLLSTHLLSNIPQTPSLFMVCRVVDIQQ